MLRMDILLQLQQFHLNICVQPQNIQSTHNTNQPLMCAVFTLLRLLRHG